jgi:hypothetical protein
MSGRWREELTTKFVIMYKDSENMWNVFTPEYKNREARLASLEHMVREMNSWHRVNNNGQLGIQLLSNWLASNWHRVNGPYG